MEQIKASNDRAELESIFKRIELRYVMAGSQEDMYRLLNASYPPSEGWVRLSGGVIIGGFQVLVVVRMSRDAHLTDEKLDKEWALAVTDNL